MFAIGFLQALLHFLASSLQPFETAVNPIFICLGVVPSRSLILHSDLLNVFELELIGTLE